MVLHTQHKSAGMRGISRLLFPYLLDLWSGRGDVCVIVQLDDEDKVVGNAVVACRLDPIHLLRLGGDATQLY